ncbi:MAG: oatA 2 [Verrucomicrobiaceae bacterium]|nr:oatA 2 [Verrucomicrobiaceae bacterium]
MASASLNSHEDIDRFALLQRIICGRMPELDGLRAIAIITVVWHNATAGRYTGGDLAKVVDMISNSGWLGVQLFFVLSGFLITGILLDQKGTAHQWRNFYARRTLRIFPLYYAALITAFILLPALGFLPPVSAELREYQSWYWLFLMNWIAPVEHSQMYFGHFWSLAVEEQFYLLWPLAVIFCRPKTLLYLCGAMIISAPLIRLGLVLFDAKFALKAAYTFTPARWDALAGGALVAIALRDRMLSQRLLLLVQPTVYLTLLYIVIFVVLNRNFAPIEGPRLFLNESIAMLLFAATLTLSIDATNSKVISWQNFLRTAPLRSIGKYSYAIYVFQLPLIYLSGPYWLRSLEALRIVLPPSISTTLFAVAVFFCAYAAAFVSWHLLESPFLQLKRRFSDSRIQEAHVASN